MLQHDFRFALSFIKNISFFALYFIKNILFFALYFIIIYLCTLVNTHQNTMKKVFTLCILGCLLVETAMANNDVYSDEMNRFITDLMSRMTLEEKLGQLNQQPSDEISTGPVVGSNASKLAAKGKLSSIFNIMDVEKIQGLQKIAVEKSRLGIPILFGMDVQSDGGHCSRFTLGTNG